MCSYTVDGKEYSSLLSLARAYNKAYSTLCSKLKRGFPLEEALGLVDSKCYKFEYRGKWYRTYRELSADYGLSWNQFTYRFYNLRQDLDTALGLTRRSIPIRNSVYFRGNVYSGYKEIASSFGIRYQTLLSRVSRGWSLERAVTTPPKK